VGGEDGAGSRHLECRLEVELRTPFLDGELTDALETEEAGVALVGVEHLRLRGSGDAGVDPQRPHATDAQEDLLPEAVLRGAAVQPVGHVTVVVGVALDVGVQE
jgi:hypothetical protein